MRRALYPSLLPSLLLAAAIGLILPGCNRARTPAGGGPKEWPVPVQVGEVISKDMPIDLRAIGNVEPINTVAVKAQVGGELIEVNFKEGQDVKKGDLLFTIQPKLYKTQLAQAEANLARDRAQSQQADLDLRRQEELGKKGVASKEELDRARAQAEALAATVKADEALVEIATVQVGYTTIESPINGRTGAVQVQAGNVIKANADDSMVSINQIAPIYVSFAIPEQYLGDIRKGMAASPLKVGAVDPRSGKTLGEGELTFAANAVDATTGTITLKATFPNDDRALWPGAFVDAILHLAVEEKAVVVPASAVMSGQRGTQVFVAKGDGTAELRPVTVGRTVGQESIISNGVQPGEKVVINGQSRLVPGAKIVIKPSGEAPSAGVASDRLATGGRG
jgi:multidrug efflux system membrane fusion protein